MKLKTKINFKKWAKVIFPLNRSLSGVGNLETLKLINKFSNRKFKIMKKKITLSVYKDYLSSK